MNKSHPSGIDVHLNDIPDNLANLVIELLDIKNFKVKMEARDTLLSMGKSIIPQMDKLLSANNELLRLEVAKIVELIADQQAIPVLIKLLNDPEFDIRWIAAEGLIKIGRKSIVPILKIIRDGEGSFFLNKGAHHVLQSLLSEKEKKVLMPLLLSLDDHLEAGETAPVEASVALKKTFRCKT